MQVDYYERKSVAKSGSCVLYALIYATHYWHRCGDGRYWNEKQGYYIDKYVMKNTATGESHELAGMVEDRLTGKISVISDRHRVLAHWEGFSGDTNKTYRMPNRTFKRSYYGDD